ncbi:MAG TPA: CAP domain-containing protein, partial [Symbiobacteriaceae bacterium]|nr:CAP domain-containing protein [Symbiobacteriaceae bacterium]
MGGRMAGGTWMRRLGGVAVGVFLLLSSTLMTGALSYYPPGPQGAIGISQPVIQQQLVLEEGEFVKSVTMLLDGAPVEAVLDASGLVHYTPPEPLQPGEHTVRLTVEIGEQSGRFTYAPLVSRFTFTVAQGAKSGLPAPGPEQVRALERVNQYRQAAKLPPLSYSPVLGAAAGGHARYLAANPAQIEVDAHAEAAGQNLFVGTYVGDRARFFGYMGGVFEVINFTDRAELAVDGWMDTIYHRIPLLAPGNTQMG